MLNCLVNSIFHILFCLALAKVLKSAAPSRGNPVCEPCIPFFFFFSPLSSPFFLFLFFFHYHFSSLHPPNSPWKDFPFWKFWFRYYRWGILIRCILIVPRLRCEGGFPFLAVPGPISYKRSCKKCCLANSFAIIKKMVKVVVLCPPSHTHPPPFPHSEISFVMIWIFTFHSVPASVRE